MAENKTQQTGVPVDEFLAGVSARRRDEAHELITMLRDIRTYITALPLSLTRDKKTLPTRRSTHKTHHQQHQHQPRLHNERREIRHEERRSDGIQQLQDEGPKRDHTNAPRPEPPIALPLLHQVFRTHRPAPNHLLVRSSRPLAASMTRGDLQARSTEVSDPVDVGFFLGTAVVGRAGLEPATQGL